VLLFSEALSLELQTTGARVLAACPGPVATHFYADMKPRLQSGEMDQPNRVVAEILQAFERGKRVVYPGKMANRLGTWGARFLTRNGILRVAAATVDQLNQKS